MTLRSVTKIGQPLISENIEANVREYFNWELLNIGNFASVYINTSGAYGGAFSRLRRSEDERYTAGQVWEGVRKQWVWESGISYSSTPINISGVYVNNTFYPLATTGAWAYKIDYTNGRVVFNTAISTSATVKCEYSYKYYQFYNSDAQWWTRLQRNSFRVDNSEFLMLNSGAWALPPEQRIQLPAVVIKAQPNIKREPRQIGGMHQWHSQQVDIHILAENNRDIKFIHDVITSQYESEIDTFNLATIAASGAWPINNVTGALNTNPATFPYLTASYPWTKLEFNRFTSNEVEVPGLPFHYAIVRLTAKTYVG